MPVLLLRLAGPMQSWGICSRFSYRDTAREPSKSGVIGLCCAALGASRDDDAIVERLAALPMGVRVDCEGELACDYQTIGGGKTAGGSYGVARADGSVGGTLVSRRDYLAGADFLVGLEGGEEALLRQLDAALRQPRWPLCLGRRSYVASVPPALGVADGALADVLRGHGSPLPGLRLVLEAPLGEGEPRYDVPVSFHPDRRAFRLRYVTSEII